MEVVSEDVLLSGSEGLSTGRLELLDVLLGHVDQERQIGRVTPETDLSQLVEQQFVLLQLSVGRELLVNWLGSRESGGELKDGLTRSREGVTLLPEEDVLKRVSYFLDR